MCLIDAGKERRHRIDFGEVSKNRKASYDDNTTKHQNKIKQ